MTSVTNIEARGASLRAGGFGDKKGCKEGERNPITFRRGLNLSLVMLDINKVGYRPVNGAKNLICEGTKTLCGHTVTVGRHRGSGIAAKQPN